MATDYRKFPPRWCPEAIPTEKGWIDPKTGELLVSVKGGVQFEEKVEETNPGETSNEEIQFNPSEGRPVRKRRPRISTKDGGLHSSESSSPALDEK